MARLVVEESTFNFTPVDETSNETKTVLAVHAGDVVLYAYGVLLVGGATSDDADVALGDGGNDDRLVDQYVLDDSDAVGTVFKGTSDAVGAFPFVYEADDTIDITYTAGSQRSADTAVRFVVGLVRSQGA